MTRDSAAVYDLLVGLRSLVQCFDEGSSASSMSVSAWVPDSLRAGWAVTQVPAISVSVPGQEQVAVVSSGDTAASGTSVTASADSPRDASKNMYSVHLAYSAKCEVYICFESPLGAYLKSEVREKIWRGGGICGNLHVVAP